MSDKTVKANQGAVSSLADTDLVMCVAQGGSYRPVAVAALARLVRESINAGGRNLALGTSDLPVVVNGASRFFDLSEPLKVGEVLTVSFEIDYGNTRPYMEVYLAPQKGGNISSRHMFDYHTFTNGLVVQTITLSKDSKCFGFYTQAGNTIKVSKLMVTRGNVPSAWAPAPEDLRGGGNWLFTNYLQVYRERRCA